MLRGNGRLPHATEADALPCDGTTQGKLIYGIGDGYFNFAYSALACCKMGTSGPASFNVESVPTHPKYDSGTLWQT
jgi:hypothetical protein